MGKLFGWDLPPGVTGREPEISGAGEEDETDSEYIIRLEDENRKLSDDRDHWKKLAEIRYRNQGKAFQKMKRLKALLDTLGIEVPK